LGEERYLFSAGGREEAELDRLRTQESFVDPATVRHLETIGVTEGWKCLEVGAGAGSIAQWLSSRVGSAGKVVATDLNLRFLNRLSAGNLEIRRHDILKNELETDHYDLAHCRKLLNHLRGPERAMQRMVDAVRPGGWLLVEEDDMGSMLSMDVTGAR
jgi:ubiquinone/menaquinone biosynthesis C-methylase UbiE